MIFVLFLSCNYIFYEFLLFLFPLFLSFVDWIGLDGLRWFGLELFLVEQVRARVVYNFHVHVYGIPQTHL